MTVTELLDRASSAELKEWMVLTKIQNNERQEAQRAANPGLML